MASVPSMGSGLPRGEQARSDAEIVQALISTSPEFFSLYYGALDQAARELADELDLDDSEYGRAHACAAHDEGGDLAGFYFAWPQARLVALRLAHVLRRLRAADPLERRRFNTALGRLKAPGPPDPAVTEYLSAVVVFPDRRGRGLGRRMLDHWIESGAARGASVFRLNVDADNLAARALYASRGFEKIGETELREGAPASELYELKA